MDDNKKEKILSSLNQDFSAIEIKNYPTRYYITKELTDSSEKSFYLTAQELIWEYESSKNYSNYDIAYIQYANNIDNGLYTDYNNISLLTEKKPSLKKYFTLPKGQYLTAYHKGKWQTIENTYKRLLEYKAMHKIQTDNIYIEYYVIDDFTSTDIEDYVTEICVKII